MITERIVPMLTTLRSRISSRAVIAVGAMSLLVSVVMGRENAPPTVIALAAPASAPGAVAEATADLDVQVLRRARNADGVPDLFAPRKPIAPPVPQAVDSQPPPPPAPSAPPLPFTYLGKLIDGEKLEVFIAQGNEHYSVEKGKTIDNQYRVEKVTASAVTFIYLPLGIRQSLPIPDPK